MRGYALCAAQRSGSNFVCELLASTGVLGRPLDYFNAVGRRDKGFADYPDGYAAQLDVALSAGATANGVYGMKVFAEHVAALERIAWAERLPNVRWIFLRRDDLLGQAISLVRAQQTGRWRSTAPSLGEARYDATAIGHAMETLARQDTTWRLFFATRDAGPLETTYEAVVADPSAFVHAVADHVGVTGAVTIDASLLTLAVQRDSVSEEWRSRFLADRRGTGELAVSDAGYGARARISVHVLTRNSGQRLRALIAEAQSYADEVVVGVDASSSDDTFDVAAAHADVTYRFRLPRPAQMAPARMLAFEYATGDWILSLDDDESMEGALDAIVPSLIRTPGVTHCYFPRKWIANEAPPLYAHAEPWFPNWSPRLFRNDRAIFWKPPEPHSMYFIEGPAMYEERCAILHFEPVRCTPEERARKIESYVRAGARPDSAVHYEDLRRAPLRPVTLRPPATPRRGRGVVHRDVRELTTASMPPWRAEFQRVDVGTELAPGASVTAVAALRNTGALAWMPTYAQWPANPWPLLRLSYRVHEADGAPLDPNGGTRMEVRRTVRPGEDVTFVGTFVAPHRAGDYIVEWDMVSEGHCWFADCGSPTYRHRITVTEDAALTR